MRLWIGVSLGEITFILIQDTGPGTWESPAPGIDNGDEDLLGGTGGGAREGDCKGGRVGSSLILGAGCEPTGEFPSNGVEPIIGLNLEGEEPGVGISST